MQEYKELMGELIELAVSVNPVAPFASCIIDPCGQIVVTAVNACHISPVFTAEGLALHKLAENFHVKFNQQLTLLTTAEPDFGAMSALCYARLSGIHVSQVIFGLSRPRLKEIWSSDISCRAEEIVARIDKDSDWQPVLTGPILEEACFQAFEGGKALHDQNEAPALPKNIDEFWLPGDWLLELED